VTYDGGIGGSLVGGTIAVRVFRPRHVCYPLSVCEVALFHKGRPLTDSEEQEIEVGASRDALRYWLAKEALRQGELGLTAQISALDAMMSRASSMFGWSVTVTLALVGASSFHTNFQISAFAALASAFLAAVCCVCALWPRNWALNGYDPDFVVNQTLKTELEVLESLAAGLAEGKRLNAVASRKVAIFLRVGWTLFCLAPAAGFLALLWRTGWR
jgi:hypothetical protein